MSFTGALARMRQLVGPLACIRGTVLLTVDATCVIAACVCAFLLRFEFSISPGYGRLLERALLIWPATKLLAYMVLGLYRRSWRHASIEDLLSLMAGNLLGSAFTMAVAVVARLPVPRSIWVTDLILCFLATAAARACARAVGEHRRACTSGKRRGKAVIYGAGAAGIALVRELRQNPSLMYDVCGFVDDAPHKKGFRIHGIDVLGSGPELSSIAARHHIETVLIAIPSATGPQMSRILDHCHGAGLTFKTVPGFSELLENNGLAHQLRAVAVEDLLGRSPVHLEQDRIADKLRGRTILVTGAAGSIGSELCRQIARFQPEAIVGYEVAETPLFHVERDMARLFPDVSFHPVIGSIQHSRRLAEVFERFGPHVVYHAAAYKHVPMMEAHCFEAVENNVLGTLNVALAAERFGVHDFVMISSDKAVRPTNVMGATKRMAELIIRSLQNGTVKYVSVRFGNVLGSNGSVVPLFKEQIARGGPVTVTHAEMRRYFMTIPEACQLVLQSSAMGHGGEIFVLDMGQPIRIVDLARHLILLSGLRPNEDIKIQFTGMRPGEKLYEELSALNEDTVGTYHEKIKIFCGATIESSTMQEHLAQIQIACRERNLDDLVLILKAVVPEYNPSSELLRSAFHKESRAVAAAVAAGSSWR
jgi:FlaA1/EpsC-like NDP-sugar epimerase